MTNPVERYTIEDWALIVAHVMRVAGLDEVRLTTEDVVVRGPAPPNRKVLCMALEPGALVLRLQTLAEARTLAASEGVEPTFYGTLRDELITKH